MKDLYIIDAAGYSYRSYFAIPSMTNAKGESTNSLFGFIRSILKFLKDFKPEHCVAIFDGKDNARNRTAIYPAYKKHRQVMPPDLMQQIQWAKEFCRLIGISFLDPEGVEADDTIGSIALHAAKQGSTVYICSTDKDLCQLVSDQIFLIDTYKDNLKIGVDAVKEKFGVPPSLIVDYLALIGDSSDNIPGVPGIGPKTAAELLNQAGSLDALLQNPDQMTGKKKELIMQNRELALISRKLALLHTEVDFPQDPHFFLIKPTVREELTNFYAAMQFNSLIREMEKENPAPAIEEQVSYTLIDDVASLNSLIAKLSKQKTICIDTQTTSINPMSAELVGIGLGNQAKEAWYIPLNGELSKESVIETLRPLFANSAIGFFGHNIKYDYHTLKNVGLLIKNISFDTMLGSYILYSHNRRHSLDELALEHLGTVKTAMASLIGKGKNEITMKEVPLEKMALYCCEGIDLTIRLRDLFASRIEERALQKLYYELELPLVKILAEMEERGIYLDSVQLSLLKEYLESELHKISREIYSLAGEEFNLNSPQQLGKILFEKLKLPPSKGNSTAQDVLEALKWDYPIAGKVQDYRILEKLRSTYVETLPSQINTKTNRIHCNFNQSVAATGRLSCQDPNLQNIPVRSDVGLRIRESFKPEKEGWSYLAADYSQIELRLLAHLSEDPVLISAFQNAEDIHAHTASVVFSVPQELVTKEMRFRAKAVNFGIIYGQGGFGLSQTLGISQKEAAHFIARYFERYPKVREFLEKCKDSARLSGKAITLTGRERILPEILSKNIQIRNAAERLAINTPFQGSAADLIKMAMLNISKELEKSPHRGYMILQIHDELIFEVPDTELDFFKKLIKDKMENVISLKVPLVVAIEVGKNWKEC